MRGLKLALLANMLVMGLMVATSGAATPTCSLVTGGTKTVTTTISVPGNYCLSTKLTYTPSTGDAIAITADNVTLDLSGYNVVNSSAGARSGVYASDKSFIIVKNGTIDGFNDGVLLTKDSVATTGHIIENLHILNSSNEGIEMECTGGVIRNNVIISSGAYGIMPGGPGNRILNNEIIDSGDTGIWANGNNSHYAIIEGNKISNTNTMGTQGIRVCSSYMLVINNRITNMDTGITFSNAGSGSGKFRDNITSGCTVSYAVSPPWVDAGNNQ